MHVHDARAPTRTDPVAAAMSAVVGGPVGTRAGGHRWWDASRALLGATAVVLGAGMLTKSACVPSGWGKQDQPFAQMCWSDLAGTSIDAGTPPHVTTWLERLAGLGPGAGVVATTAALAVLLAGLALLATALLARTDPRRPWAAAGWALAPCCSSTGSPGTSSRPSASRCSSGAGRPAVAGWPGSAPGSEPRSPCPWPSRPSASSPSVVARATASTRSSRQQRRTSW